MEERIWEMKCWRSCMFGKVGGVHGRGGLKIYGKIMEERIWEMKCWRSCKFGKVGGVHGSEWIEDLW
jgi:hypothetical protein